MALPGRPGYTGVTPFLFNRASYVGSQCGSCCGV